VPARRAKRQHLDTSPIEKDHWNQNQNPGWGPMEGMTDIFNSMNIGSLQPKDKAQALLPQGETEAESHGNTVVATPASSVLKPPTQLIQNRVLFNTEDMKLPHENGFHQLGIRQPLQRSKSAEY
jgi:hypothetical protein